ncbi:MAG TPA: phosphate ABC transporter substrate-binding protein PstS [Phycisphaerae bacterium]|nr:phosphate ABC transporter substrate-binding protein PstS [Phycisphaerae bacterium]
MFKALKSIVTAGAALLLAATVVQADPVHLNADGGTFPAPLYAKWIQVFNAANPDIVVDYQAVGSGAGIKAISGQLVPFAGSDAPLTDAQEQNAPGKILHIPTVAGPEVMTYNLPGLNGQLVLDGQTIADIYMGNVTSWNDPEIQKLNPNLNLPNLPIAVAHRSDGSGTTYIFTDYLSHVSSNWASQVGNATAVQWPVGQGGKGNAGVAAIVKNTVGGIGYVEYAYALNGNLTYAALVNHDGNTVQPSIAGVVAAAQGMMDNIPDDFRLHIVDAPGADSYPICGFTYLLVYQDLDYLKDPNEAQALVKWLVWCETDGQQYAAGLKYASLPSALQQKIMDQLKTITFNGQLVWTGQ